jgi:hypothetical protein
MSLDSPRREPESNSTLAKLAYRRPLPVSRPGPRGFAHLARLGPRRGARAVYLPPGYHENTLRTYPVLYMQDGANLFFAEEACGGSEWQVDETMDRLDRMNAVRKVIVVGIAPIDRMRDYTRPRRSASGATTSTPPTPCAICSVPVFLRARLGQGSKVGA